ncbi:neprilysin-2-like [Amblyomma americanum]
MAYKETSQAPLPDKGFMPQPTTPTAKTAVGHPTVPQLQAGTKKADPETGGPRDSSHILDTSKTPSAVKAAQAADVSKAFLAPEAGTESQINKEEAGSAARLLTAEEKARHATNQAQTAEREESLLKTHTLFFRSPLVSPESPPGTRGALLASAAASADQPDSKTSPKLAAHSQPSNSVGPPATAAQSATTIATKAGTPAGKDTKQPSSFSHSKLLAVATDTDARAVAATSPASVQPAATEPVATRLYILGYRSPSRLSLASISEQVATPVPVTKASEVTLKEKETSLPKGETEASSPPRDVTAAIAIRKTSSEVMHKARGIHKCDKHRNETEAEYERRKARAKAKAKEKAEAEEEKQTSDVKGRSRKSRKGEASMTKPLIRDKSESPAMKKGQLSPEKFRPGVASDHYVKGQTRQSPLCCIIVLVLLIIFLILLLVLWLKKEPEETTSSVSPTTHPILKIYYCSSDVCNAEAAYLKSLISKSIKPCDNFYEYVCEGWTKSHAIPGEGAGAGLSMDTLLQDRLASDVEPTLLGIPDADVKTAAALHEDCMRRDKVGHDGDTVVNVARELFQAWAIKEWPIFKGKTITHSTAWLFAGELVRDLNVAALATVGVGVSPKVLEAAAIELDEPRLVFSCNDASRPAVTKLFKDALMEVMSRFAAASATVGSGDVDDVLGVFTRLASSPAIAASPDTSPLVYTNVKLIELDTGFKNFLEGVFNIIVTIDGTTEVVLKSPDYLRNHLPAAMQELSPHAVVNYLGFMALVKAAPFFPERFSNLRQIFGKDVLGRTLPDVSQTKTLCLLAVQQVLPACFAKAAVKLRGMSRTDLPLTEWLSRLESSFGRHQERVAWINELSALIVRYRLKRNRRVAFSSRHEPCAPSPQEIPRRSEHPLRFFHQVSMLQEQKRLQLVLKTGQEVLALRGEARSELATIPEYDVMRQAVHVPMALFNTSVASNTTMFSFHLSRVAVRLYRALVQILFPRNIYERDAPLALTEETLRRLDELLSCFEKDLRVLPAALRGPVSVDSAKFRGALLQHAAAVKLGFRAFRDHLTVRRVWQVDFRFKDLPEFSSDALFFLYYALDNCESADTVYAEHRGTWMPARYRVNAALRHVKEFAEPFECRDGDQMALSAQMCHVLKKD